MKIVVGLGNPGRRYARTPHNAGFDTVAALAGRWGCRLRPDTRTRARTAIGRPGGEGVLLVQPQTYMNESGAAVGAIVRYRKAVLEDVIVVLDDADLPPGALRIRGGGGSGGHRGLASVIAHVGGESFARVRIGIGRDAGGGELVEHVLRRPDAAARRVLEETCERAADAVEVWLREGVEPAMNRFNRRAAENDGLTDAAGAE